MLAARSGMRSATGRSYSSERPKSRRSGAGEPVAILRANRSIQPVARARLFDGLAARVEAHRLGDEIARREPRQHQRRGRHGEHQEEREREPPRDVGDHRGTVRHRVRATTAAAGATRRASRWSRASTRRRTCAARRNRSPAGARRRSSGPRRTAACARHRRATASACAHQLVDPALPLRRRRLLPDVPEVRAARAEPEIGAAGRIGVGQVCVEVHGVELPRHDLLDHRAAFERDDVDGDADLLQLVADDGRRRARASDAPSA